MWVANAKLNLAIKTKVYYAWMEKRSGSKNAVVPVRSKVFIFLCHTFKILSNAKDLLLHDFIASVCARTSQGCFPLCIRALSQSVQKKSQILIIMTYFLQQSPLNSL